MKKKIVFVLIAVLLLTAFASVSNAGAITSKLQRGVGYSYDDLMEMKDLQDPNCGFKGYELCETLGHFGILSTDVLTGKLVINGMFLAPNGLWYKTHPLDVYNMAGNSCYPYDTVAFHQSGACPLDSKNPLCKDYIAMPGYVYNWYPDNKWPEGVVPEVSGYYAAGNPVGSLFCKIK